MILSTQFLYPGPRPQAPNLKPLFPVTNHHQDAFKPVLKFGYSQIPELTLSINDLNISRSNLHWNERLQVYDTQGYYRRMPFHPTLTNQALNTIVNAITRPSGYPRSKADIDNLPPGFFVIRGLEEQLKKVRGVSSDPEALKILEKRFLIGLAEDLANRINNNVSLRESFHLPKTSFPGVTPDRLVYSGVKEFQDGSKNPQYKQQYGETTHKTAHFDSTANIILFLYHPIEFEQDARRQPVVDPNSITGGNPFVIDVYKKARQERKPLTDYAEFKPRKPGEKDWGKLNLKEGIDFSEYKQEIAKRPDETVVVIINNTRPRSKSSKINPIGVAHGANPLSDYTHATRTMSRVYLLPQSVANSRDLHKQSTDPFSQWFDGQGNAQRFLPKGRNSLKNVLEQDDARTRFRQFISNGPVGHLSRDEATQQKIIDDLFAFMDEATDPVLGLSEAEYISSIRHYVQNCFARSTTFIPDAQEDRAKWSIKEIFEYFGKVFPDATSPTITSYMDIGCGNGKVAEAMARELKLSKDNVFANDEVKPPQSRFYTTNWPNKSSIDLMTMLTVLHHANDPVELLKGAKRKLKPGGYLVIREHDYDKKSIIDHDIQHSAELFYSSVYPKNYDSHMRCPENYNSKEDWRKIFTDCGYEILLTERVPGQPLKPFYAVLQKRTFTQTLVCNTIAQTEEDVIHHRLSTERGQVLLSKLNALREELKRTPPNQHLQLAVDRKTEGNFELILP